MNYKHLDEKMKVKIDFLLEQGLSMRACARQLQISHSTISRYKNNVYKKRVIDIQEKYKDFLDYLYKNYDWRCKSIEVCVNHFRKFYSRKRCVSTQQVYNWINTNKIDIKVKDTCYKRKRRKSKNNGMMAHLQWNLEHKTVFPISLRPKYIENRDEIGHLEIDSIVGKRNEYDSIISIVDRCSRMIWLIKADYKQEHYINNLIYNFIKQNDITVKSITTDNGLEFNVLGIAAKRLGVKLYKCDPYCSFQRGTNERSNALVRRFLPKGKSFIQVGQQYLDDISFKLNSMPRKIFDFKTPYEIDFIQTKIGAVEI